MARIPSDRTARLDSQTWSFHSSAFWVWGGRWAFVKCSRPGIVTIFWGRYNYPWLAADKKLPPHENRVPSWEFGFKGAGASCMLFHMVWVQTQSVRKCVCDWKESNLTQCDLLCEDMQAEDGGFSGFEFNCELLINGRFLGSLCEACTAQSFASSFKTRRLCGMVLFPLNRWGNWAQGV